MARLQLPPKTALVVIDVQIGFDDPLWGPRNNPDAEINIGRLLAAWRQNGRPILHVRHDSIVPGSPLRPNQPGNAIKPIAAPLAGETVYAKTVNSAFIGTTLEADLRRQAIESLVIVGLTTNHCVSTTARMAGNLGFAAFVVEDATASFDRPTVSGRLRSAARVHEAALSDLHGEFATVVTTEDVLTSEGAR